MEGEGRARRSRVIERLVELARSLSRVVCSIAGESGVGKTTLTEALRSQLEAGGHPTRVLHQDDYFFLLPRDNHQRRIEEPTWVGPCEVDLERLQSDIVAHRKGVLLVEGTYVTALAGIDLRVFIEGDYRQTDGIRHARSRDLIDETTNRVLAVEHEIITQQSVQADLIIPMR
jgi:hypothetical protein